MSFQWLKKYMPRGLYGRTALILVLPVVVLQLAVSVVFIGNHLQDVTTQMSLTVLRELQLVSAQAVNTQTQAQAMMNIAPIADQLGIKARFLEAGQAPEAQPLWWIDYSARVVRRVLSARSDAILAVNFPDKLTVEAVLETGQGPLELSFNRRRVSAAAPHQLIVTMVFFGGLMTVIAFLYMRNQLRPILRLADAAQAFGRGYTVPYGPSGAREVRIAGGAFLDMRARIERQIEQRTLMLSGVSHDLRTPLTRMKLGLSMIDEEDATPLLRDVDEMQALVDAFLDFAKGTAEGEMVPTDPITLAHGVVEDATRAGKVVKLVASQGQGEVMLRGMALRRALSNLINNAVRYGTRAEVSVVLTDKSLRYRVEDDGPGIPPDLRGDAMKPFTRLDPSRNQNAGSGVGLGLAIVADIARAHGGVLRLGQSESLGGLRADIVIGR